MTSPAGSDRGRGAAGFSLVELLAVAAIMGLLAGVAAVSLRGLRTPALSSAANEVASAVKMTRQMAIASGRNMVLVIPVTASPPLATNPYRTYAILEEVGPGQEMRTPDTQGNYPTNTNTFSWFIPRTDWQTLPEGVVFYGMYLRTNVSASTDETAFGPIGSPEDRSGNFQPVFTNLMVGQSGNPTNRTALGNVPYLLISPAGRFQTANYMGNFFGASLRLALGTVRGAEITVTDTNNHFLIETDSQIGRVRVRTPESYAP